MSHSKINVASLLAGNVASINLVDQTMLPPVNHQNDQIIFEKPVELELKLLPAGRDVEAIGTVKTGLVLACSRCLRDFSFPLETEIKEIFYHPKSPADKDDFRIVNDEIDLTPMITQNLVLSIPFQPLCKQNCLGLCPQCGQDLNEAICHCSQVKPHPGFAVLKDFFKNSGKKD